jgi:hypothetical protein
MASGSRPFGRATPFNLKTKSFTILPRAEPARFFAHSLHTNSRDGPICRRIERKNAIESPWLIPQRQGPPDVYVWNTERHSGESWHDFVKRGASEALAAVQQWPGAGALGGRGGLSRLDSKLQCRTGRKVNLWQDLHEIAEKGSKIVLSDAQVSL